MDLKHNFTFGGVNTANYGIFISGEGVYNSPERDVTMLTVPGRNGQLTIDNGRFENIEVTYPCFIEAGTGATDISARIRAFRNAIGSLTGYQRLEDTYHSDEYREGIFKAGLNVEPVVYHTGGEFEITFDCKPQRWLTSGENAISLTSGDTIPNAEAFASKPLLVVAGAGSIQLDSKTIVLGGSLIGDIDIVDTKSATGAQEITVAISDDLLVTGDDITASIYTGAPILVAYGIDAGGGYITSRALSSETETGTGQHIDTSDYSGQYGAIFTFNKGTTATQSHTWTYTVDGIYYPGGVETAVTGTVTVTISAQYTGTEVIFTYTVTPSVATITVTVTQATNITGAVTVRGNSTRSTLGETIYIDCDLGAAYTYDSGGNIVNLNSSVTLPSTLPEIPAGGAAVTFDVSTLSIIPRWWRI